MKIIGCDIYTCCQQIARLDDQTGELIERRLEQESGEAEQFYRGLAGPVRVGIEATGPIQWFQRHGCRLRSLTVVDICSLTFF